MAFTRKPGGNVNISGQAPENPAPSAGDFLDSLNDEAPPPPAFTPAAAPMVTTPPAAPVMNTLAGGTPIQIAQFNTPNGAQLSISVQLDMGRTWDAETGRRVGQAIRALLNEVSAGR